MAKTLNIALNISGEAVNAAIRATASNNAIRRYELPTDEFAASAADKEVLAPIDISAASFVMILPTTDVTLKTNSTSEADDTKTLSAGQGFVWWNGCGFDLSDYFSADITAMYFTNGDEAAAGSVAIVIVDDATL